MDYLMNLINGSYSFKNVTIVIDTETPKIAVYSAFKEEPTTYTDDNAKREIKYIFDLFACNVDTIDVCLEKWLDKEHIRRK